MVASPSGGLVAGWACDRTRVGRSTAPAVVGLTAFDALGPPIVALSAKGSRVTFTLGETARYTLVATRGSRRVSASGTAAARDRVTRTLRLTPGTWRVTLRARLGSGNASTRSATARVAG